MVEYRSVHDKLEEVTALERELGIHGTRLAFRDELATVFVEDVIDDVLAAYRGMKTDPTDWDAVPMVDAAA